MSRKTSEDPKAPPHPDDWGPRSFESAGYQSYRLSVPQASTEFLVSRLRRERHELIGELTVKCGLAGARTIRGVLSAGDFNLSGIRSRSERAKHLQTRACAADVDWEGLLGELCQGVIEAERAGTPAVLLSDVPLEHEDTREFNICGLTLPIVDASILFGDGGASKSYLALWIAGHLARQGQIVLYGDWESNQADHRRRLAHLFAPALPPILYARCEAPLVSEVDRLRRIVAEHGVTYLVCDSVAYGCPGKPEDAEHALAYFRALRSLGDGLGSLLIAHVTKAEDGDKKPFGSSFWHNSARSTWHVRRSNPDAMTPAFHVLATNQKVNNGRRQPKIAFHMNFTAAGLTIERTNPADVDEFATDLPVRDRLRDSLRRGPLTVAELSELTGIPENTIRQEVTRKSHLYVKLVSSTTGKLYKVGLKENEREN